MVWGIESSVTGAFVVYSLAYIFCVHCDHLPALLITPVQICKCCTMVGSNPAWSSVLFTCMLMISFICLVQIQRAPKLSIIIMA